MANQVNNYQCPACTAPLRFDGKSGKLVCDFCDSSYTVEEIENLNAEANKAAEEASMVDTNSANVSWGNDAEKMRAYSCPSCGAEIICDETTAATSCPYCNNPSIIPGQFLDEFKPEYIIPFKQDKKDAIAALKQHYKGKKLLPKVFADQNHVEDVKGVYVPFWLYDSEVEGSVSFKATKSSTHRIGNEEVVRTKHYNVVRAADIDFDKVPVDASKKMDNDYMDALEPFNYDDLTDFNLSFLPGFYADKYDDDKQETARRADEKCLSSALQQVMGQVSGYDTVDVVNNNLKVHRKGSHYAMLPVWILNTKWQDKDYMFAMNGQTGKVVGDLPISAAKVLQWTLKLFIPLSIVVTIITSIFMGGSFGENSFTGVGVGAFITVIILLMFRSGMKSVHAVSASSYVPNEGFAITDSKDVYTHTTETRRVIETKQK